MSALNNKINQLKSQHLNTEFFDKTQFLRLLKGLEPEYTLTNEEIHGIFDFTDESKKGELNKAEVYRVLDMILASEEENQEESSGENPPKRDTIGYIRHSIKVQNNRLSSSTVNEIDIDTISELKHIYSICEGNKGYANLDQIAEFMSNFKQLSSSLHHLLKIFNCVKDPDRNIVTREAFSNLMSKLEKAILNQFADENDDDNKPSSREDLTEQKRVMESMFGGPSEIGSDSDEDHNSEEDQGKNYNQDLIQEVLLVIQKVDEAVDTLKNKATATSIKGVQSILGEVIGICYHMEKDLKNTGEKVKDMKHKLHEGKNIEELLNAKIGTLELNNKHNEEVLQELQNEYDALFDSNRALESQLRVYMHIQDDMTEKNNEIVRLERKVKDVENSKIEIQNQLRTCEDDRNIAIQNYKDLDSLFKKQEERIQSDEDQIRASQQIKEISSYEIDALKIELKSAIAKKEAVEKDKLGFERVISELRENLINNKEFLDSLRLEKNDLQSKYNKLQKELDALKSENMNKRMSLPKRISIRNDDKNLSSGFTLDLFSAAQNLDVSMSAFQRIPEVNEPEAEEETTEKNLSEVLDVEDQKEEPVQEPEELPANNTSPEKVVPEAPEEKNTAELKEEIKRKPTTAIDLRQLSQDYLGLRQTWAIKKILEKNKERDDKICFSDYMYRINSKEKRERRVLFITSEALYSLRPRKGYSVIRRIPLEKIYRITVSKSSAGLCAIHVHKDYDYLIDTYKRLNLLLFLQNVFRFKSMKQFSIAYEHSFMVKNRKATALKQIDQYSKAVANPELQSTYKNAQKFGELFVKTGSLFQTWTTHFFILTEVGFVCFSKAGNSKPIDFIPILGYMIIDKGTTSNGKYAFKIKFPHSDFEITLAANSEIEKSAWIQKIKALQENAILEQ